MIRIKKKITIFVEYDLEDEINDYDFESPADLENYNFNDEVTILKVTERRIK